MVLPKPGRQLTLPDHDHLPPRRPACVERRVDVDDVPDRSLPRVAASSISEPRAQPFATATWVCRSASTARLSSMRPFQAAGSTDAAEPPSMRIITGRVMRDAKLSVAEASASESADRPKAGRLAALDSDLSPSGIAVALVLTRQPA